MRVLWITGSLLPEAIAKIKGEEPQQWNSTGSWIIGAAEALVKMDGIDLYMLSTSQLVSDVVRVEAGGITSYAIPYGKGHFNENHSYEKYMKPIHDEIRPDIVHIHGTEYSHGLAYLRVNGSRHLVISMQGMTSVICKHYFDGMNVADVISHLSFRDLIRGGIFREKASFRRRGLFEQEMIRSVGHIIGRTSWDYAHVKVVNPSVVYHYGGETLRDQFYSGVHWNYDQCVPHTIFLSQSNAPYKGLHQLLRALPLILRQYPDTQVRIAGLDLTLGYRGAQWWRLSGYARYIKSLIKKYRLKNHITFVGPLDADGMKQEYLHSNLYLCPSAIENSPNSLGEAQILGVPCVAAYVGGVMDLMKGNEENLYRYEEIEMLADKVCRVFRDKEKQVDFSSIAAKRHHPQENVSGLLQIYHDIIAGSEKPAKSNF